VEVSEEPRDGAFAPSSPPGSTPPPSPSWGSQNRVALVIGIAVLILAVLGGLLWLVRNSESDGERAADPKSYSKHGLGFEIPDGLRLYDEDERSSLEFALPDGIKAPTSGEWYEVLGQDRSNLLIVFPDELSWIVDESNLEIYGEVIVRGAAEIADEVVRITPRTLAGFPALEVAPHEVEMPGGGHATSEVVEAFNRNVGYGFICQYTEGTRMASLCDDVLDTVSIEPVDPPGEGWATLDSGGGHRVDVPPAWSEDAPLAAELINAGLFVANEEIPLAHLQVWTEPIIGTPPPRRFVNDFIRRTRQDGFELVDQRSVTLPSGAAERLVLRSGTTRLVAYALVHDSQGVVVGVLTYSGQSTMDLFVPTAGAIAESLTIEG
jgi:hypothetical protein